MTYKNRGMLLEKIINKTINLYWRNDFAFFHKKSIPMKIKKVSKEKNSLNKVTTKIIGKSTTDYYGFFKGVFISFEAKSTESKSLPLSNIHKHQHEYLNLVNRHGGLGFYIIYFKINDSFYFLHSNKICKLKKKSIDLIFIKKEGIRMELIYPGILDFMSIARQYV